jgi:hypothetical protein
MATRFTAGRLIGAMLAIGLAVSIAPAASADGNRDAQYYRSAVTAVEPAVRGLEVVVHGSGDSVTLTNNTGRAVTVVGYSGEDYLRISSDGVEENTNSLTAALNTDRGRMPDKLSGQAKPQRPSWRTLSEGNSFTWSDFRTKWSAEQRPPIVQADPQAQHQVFTWAMQLKVGKQPTLVRGTLTWTGAPRFGTTNLIAIAILTGLVLAGLVLALWLRSRRRRSPAGSHARTRALPETPAPAGAEPARVVLDRVAPEEAALRTRFDKTVYPSVSVRN